MLRVLTYSQNASQLLHCRLTVYKVENLVDDLLPQLRGSVRRELGNGVGDLCDVRRREEAGTWDIRSVAIPGQTVLGLLSFCS